MDKEYARRLLAGEIPMENPRIKKPGDPAYYYFDPRGVTEHTKFKDRKLIGVPTADTPNPALVDKQTQFSLNNKFNNNGIKYAQNNINYVKSDTNNIQYDNHLSEQERRNVLKINKAIKLNIEENPNASKDWPWYHSHTLGQAFTKYHSKKIDTIANKYNFDPDIVKAIMYTENADGHWFGGNYLRDFLKISKSQAPMNIQGKLWSDIGGQKFDTYNSDQNIELSVLLLKRLSETIDKPTVAKIGTLWNSLAKDKISNFGARVEHNYNNKYWDFSKEPPQILSKDRKKHEK